MNYQSNAKIPLWSPAISLLGEYRGLIRSMVRRDLTSRYKGSVMGAAWAIITPAVMIVIFTLVFSGIFNARFGAEGGHLDFAIYLFCGMLPWIAFSDGVQRSTTSLIENVNLVKRVVFPIEALPVNVAFSALVHQLLGTLVLMTAALLVRHKLPPTAFLAMIVLIPQLMLTLGLGWLMASMGVFIRDMPQFNQLLFSTWMYLTPIIYPETFIPLQYRWLMNLNPMAPIVRNYRRLLLDGAWPDWPGLAFSSLVAVSCLGLGYWWFEKTKKAFADVL